MCNFDEAKFLSEYGVTPGLPINTRNLVVYAREHDIQPAEENYLWAFLGDTDPSSVHRLYMRDHADLWLRHSVPYAFTIQPYASAVNWPRAHREWSNFAERHGLQYRILPAGSGWYNPQRTVCVEFTFDYEKRWDLPFFYDEVVDMREHPERYEHFC